MAETVGALGNLAINLEVTNNESFKKFQQYYDAVMIGIGLKNLIGQGLEACYRYAKSAPQIENTAKLADDLENLVLAIDDLPIDAQNKLDLLKTWAELQLKKMEGIVKSSSWSYLIKQGVGDEVLNLLIKEFGNTGNIANNAFINLRRKLRNKTLTMQDLKTNSDVFKKWLAEYKSIINSTEPFEWGLRFLLKQNGFERITLTNMKKLFVDAFPTSVRRAKLYEDYLQYITDLKAIIGKDTKFTQLTFGSFIRDKVDPGDIDFIIFIPFEKYYENTDKLIELNRTSRNKLFLGEKTLEPTQNAIFPTNHSKYESKFIEELDLILKNYATADKAGVAQKTLILEF